MDLRQKQSEFLEPIALLHCLLIKRFVFGTETRVTGDEEQRTMGRRKKRGARFPPSFYIERETVENEAAVDHSIHRAAGLDC